MIYARGYIYRISFIGSDKCYIGLSTDYKTRWRSHKNSLRKGNSDCIGVQNAYDKYGKESMIFTLLETSFNIDYKFLEQREKYYVKVYNSYYNGYNCTEGGSIKDFKIRGNSRKVYMFDCKTGEYIKEFPSMTSVKEGLGISDSSVREICQSNKRKSSKGFHFSLSMKTPEEVLSNIIPAWKREETRKKASESKLGEKHWRFLKLKISFEEIHKMRIQGVLWKDIVKLSGGSISGVGTRYKKEYYDKNKEELLKNYKKS